MSIGRDGTAGLLKLTVLFAVVAFTFFGIRSTQGLVWNDSPQTAENLYGFGDAAPGNGQGGVCRDQGAYGLAWHQEGLARTILRRAFSCLEFGGYRPLSAALSHTGVAIWSDALRPEQPRPILGAIWTAWVAGLFGALAVLLFLVTRRFVRTDWAALFALVLFFASPPMVSGAWILFSGGIQVTVPLLICLGLWLYFRATTAARPGPWLAGLFLVLFLGPWVREFVGLVAVLVILLETQRHRRPTAIAAVALLSFAHAVFPTFLVSAVVPDLPVVPVFSLGSLGAQMGGGGVGSLLASLRWEMSRVFLVVLPPSLFVVLAAMLVWMTRHDRVAQAVTVAMVGLAAVLAGQPWVWTLVVIGFCGAVGLKAVRDPETRDDLLFLTAWFLLSFLPFLKVFTAHVHLAYALIPAVILAAAIAERFVIDLGGARVLRVAAVTMLAFLAFDQALNVYGSYTTVNGLYGGIRYMAGWMQRNVPAGTTVVANALHAEDIRLYSDNQIIPFWSVGVGVPPERTVEHPEELRALLQRASTPRRVVMLDITQRFSPAKADYHAHKYVTRRTVSVQAIGRVHDVVVRYPFVDPLRLLLPRPLVLFLGPPDLENDVYTGPAQSGTPFHSEMSVSYDVYAVTEPTLSPRAEFLPDSTFFYPRYLETYRAHALYGYRDRLIAVPEGVPSDESTLASSDARLLTADSIESLRAAVDDRIAR